MSSYSIKEPIPMALRPKVWGLRPVAGSNTAGGMEVLWLLCVV